jgi:hypothetical protein
VSATGQTTIDFGTGNTDVSVAVTGQASILAGSLAEAWLFPSVTASNEIDNHLIDDITVIAHSVVAGTGFTIFVKCNNGLAHGIFNVAWIWA